MIVFNCTRSLYISDTYTNIFCQVAGKAILFNYFNKGSRKSLLFSNIAETRSLDLSSLHSWWYSLDRLNRISMCSVTYPSRTKTFIACSYWVFAFRNRLLHSSRSCASFTVGKACLNFSNFKSYLFVLSLSFSVFLFLMRYTQYSSRCPSKFPIAICTFALIFFLLPSGRTSRASISK